MLVFIISMALTMITYFGVLLVTQDSDLAFVAAVIVGALAIWLKEE